MHVLRILAFLVLAAAPSGTVDAGVSCGQYAGTYIGQAKTAGSRDAADVTVNLYCSVHGLAAQLFTSIGDFDVKTVGERDGHLIIDFDSGAALGTLRFNRIGSKLAGIVDLGGDRGPVVLRRIGAAMAANAWTPRLDLTPAQWRNDLDVLARELPRRHANAFFSLSRAAFAREVNALATQIEHRNGDEMWVGLQQIVRSIGDGHTAINGPLDRRVMPLEFTRFGNDIRVTAAGPGLEKALGAKGVKVGNVPIEEAWRRVLTLTPRAELMELREGQALIYLARGYALHGLDLISDRNRASYTLQDDSGHIFTITTYALANDKSLKMKSGYSGTALRYQNPDDSFWCKSLPAQRAVYCAWHAYQELTAKVNSMFALINSVHPQKLIIDLRDNGGGDYTVGYAALVKPLIARADLNRKGHLFVLIGPLTFSAAMNNAAQFQDQTHATLVGQTIGEKPNSYQEPRQFRLPNSHLIVRVSTLYYVFRKRGENAVRPVKEIVPIWSDAKPGRDPALAWVLTQRVD